jgi:hypothetical protein
LQFCVGEHFYDQFFRPSLDNAGAQTNVIVLKLLNLDESGRFGRCHGSKNMVFPELQRLRSSELGAEAFAAPVRIETASPGHFADQRGFFKSDRITRRRLGAASSNQSLEQRDRRAAPETGGSGRVAQLYC